MLVPRMASQFRCLALFSFPVAMLLLAAASAQATTYYDVDFGTPPHTVGLPPVIGGGPIPRATVSSIVFGTPLVVASLGSLTNQPLQLSSTDGLGDQVSFSLNGLPAADRYCFSSQVLVSLAQGTADLAVLFDAPTVRSIRFRADGTVAVFVSGGGTIVIGNYTIGRVVDLRVQIDLAANLWAVYLDNVLAHSGSFGGATALSSVRISTPVTPSPPGLLAGVDNLLLGDCAVAPAPCNQLGFEDLALGATFGNGASFATGGATLTVRPFFTTLGPCGGSTAANQARVGNLARACGAGQELEVNNVNLDFDFGGPVTDVVIPYGEYGGNVNLTINGDCRSVANFADLSGIIVGAVGINVIDFGPPGQGCGVIVLSGDVSDLLVGGQELFIDEVSYCNQCPQPRRSLFDDLPLGNTYTVGQFFTSGNATYEVKAFYFPGATCLTPFNGGQAQVQNLGRACGLGREMNLNNVNLRIDFGAGLEWIRLDYGEYGGNVNLTINGDCRNAADLVDLNGATVGGAQVWVVSYGAPGQSCGVLYASGGPIGEFQIGGQELWIDTVRACPEGTAAVADPAAMVRERILLEQNVPNPFNPSTTIAFTLNTASAAHLAIYDVQGRLVRTLVAADLAPGRHEVAWNGLNEQGQRVPSGHYLYRLEAGAASATRRMIMLK